MAEISRHTHITHKRRTFLIEFQADQKRVLVWDVEKPGPMDTPIMEAPATNWSEAELLARAAVKS
jgi:hypothetical protein